MSAPPPDDDIDFEIDVALYHAGAAVRTECMVCGTLRYNYAEPFMPGCGCSLNFTRTTTKNV